MALRSRVLNICCDAESPDYVWYMEVGNIETWQIKPRNPDTFVSIHAAKGVRLHERTIDRNKDT